MGSLNLHPELEVFKGGCIICGSKDVTPIVGDAAKSCYEYVCENCNPKVKIVVTDFLVMDKLLRELLENDEAKARIHEDIKHFDGKEYSLGINSASYFLELEFKNRKYTYNDWWDGNLGGKLKLFNISEKELSKIEFKQKEILTDKVDGCWEKLISDFEENSINSINAEEFLKNEIKDVENLLGMEGTHFMHLGPIMNDFVEIGRFKMMVVDILDLRKYYHEAVRGITDYSIIDSPNQKIWVGGARPDLAVIGISYGKYLSFLKEKNQKNIIVAVESDSNYIMAYYKRNKFVIDIIGVIAGVVGTLITIIVLLF